MMEMHENKNVAEASQSEREREAKSKEREAAIETARVGVVEEPKGRPSGDDLKEGKAGGAVAGGQAGAARTAAGNGSKARTRKNNLKKLRLERMMSKAELARRAGVSTLTIDRVERGMSCRMDTKRKILEALGLKPSERAAAFGDDE